MITIDIYSDHTAMELLEERTAKMETLLTHPSEDSHLLFLQALDLLIDGHEQQLNDQQERLRKLHLSGK